MTDKQNYFTYTDNTSDSNDKTMENLHKQIIIDGVDVSFCTHHYNGWSNLHRDTRPMCEIGYDRECEPKHFECSHYVKCLEQQLKRKEQELEQYKQTLAEIKEIAEKTLNMVDYKTYFKRDNKSLKQEGFKSLNEILQKIREVE